MSYKINIKNFLFNLNFIIFFISLFLDDLSFTTDISKFIVFLKSILLITLILSLLLRNINIISLKKSIYLLMFILFILIATRDFFFLIMILLGYQSIGIEEKKIYKLSLNCYTVGLIITLLLLLMGYLTDFITYRTDFSNQARHSLGFNFSAVLPLMICYMLCNYIALKGRQRKIKLSIMVLYLISSYIIYKICVSRNAFYITVFLFVSVFIFNNNKIRLLLQKPLKFTAKWILPICLILSIFPAYMRFKGLLMPIWYKYDSIFTNRTLLGAAAIESYGIKLINIMNYNHYSSIIVNVDSFIHEGIVLDSAYIYILIRYGLIILIFFSNILYNYYKKNNDDIYSCLVYIAIVILNMTDNDLLSYGCLPFLLISVKSMIENASEK